MVGQIVGQVVGEAECCDVLFVVNCVQEAIKPDCALLCLHFSTHLE
jgi:hypothetical protein